MALNHALQGNRDLEVRKVGQNARFGRCCVPCRDGPTRGRSSDNRECDVWVEGFRSSSKHSFWHSVHCRGAWTHSGEESWFQGERPQGGRRTGTGVDACTCGCRCWRSLNRKGQLAFSRHPAPLQVLTDWTQTGTLSRTMRMRVSESQIQKQPWSPSGPF